MQAPWHLWGNSQVITCPYTGVFATTTATAQLAKVSYARPDTWAFHFFASIQSTKSAVQPPTVTKELQVHFDLMIGVGRSSVQMPDFEVYKFTAGLGSTLDGQIRYSTTVNGPVRDPDIKTVTNLISRFSAESIQCQARAVYTRGETHDDSAQVFLYAAFTPMTHVRPEWIKQEFPGGEDTNGH